MEEIAAIRPGDYFLFARPGGSVAAKINGIHRQRVPNLSEKIAPQTGIVDRIESRPSVVAADILEVK